MIKIEPETLKLAGRLTEIREAARETDGFKNWSRHHVFSYEGDGFLTLMTTDNRLGVVSRLPVVGTASPWSATILARPFDHIKKYLTGGQYELDPSDRVAVVLRKSSYQYPLLRGEPGAAFPLLPAPPTNGTGTFESAFLERALSLLVDTSQRWDDESGLDFCSLFEDGLVAFGEKGIYWKTRGPIVPFPVNLRRPDAFRVWKWLRVIGGPNSMATMHVAVIANDGRPAFLFWTQDRAHFLQVRAAPRSFPRRAVEGSESESPAITGDVDREQLRRAAGMSRQGAHRKLDFEFGTREDGQHVLKVRFEIAGATCGGDTLSVDNWQQADGLEDLGGRFNVGSHNLELLLGALAGSRVKLAFHKRAHILSIRAVSDDTGHLDVVNAVGFLRTGLPVPAQEPTITAPDEVAIADGQTKRKTQAIEGEPALTPAQMS